MRSMTALGIGEAPLCGGRVVVEVRSVNGRFLDVRVRVPREAQDHATHLEVLVRQVLARGRVELVARFEGTALPTVRLDTRRAEHVLTELIALRDRFAPGEPVPLSVLASVPDLFAAATGHEQTAVRDALEAATRRALAALDAMRTDEGRALATDLAARVTTVERALEIVRARVPEVIGAYRRRLADRVAQLAQGAAATLDPPRLEQEIALFADRADVSEELVRLASHAAQLRGLISDDADGTGRRFDFLLQEMAREANTIASKSADAETTHLVVDVKSEIERMREQAQNIA